MNDSQTYDVIVIGAGHAGCEAALAAARLGARTALLAADPRAIGRMSCNPSIGGIAKSHIVFEVDALGGEMARNTDYTGIQFRTLNTRKGPAVQAHRAQCDKHIYPLRMQAIVNATPSLSVISSMVSDLYIHNGSLKGVRTNHGLILGKTVVITAGTFLNGVIHIGTERSSGGRMGEAAACELSDSMRDVGIELGRMKTGTPPRLHRDSVDFDRMELQPGLEPPPLFSWAARREEDRFRDPDEATRRMMFHVEHVSEDMRPWTPGTDQIPCYLTRTTETTHQIISDNLESSAMYGGSITGTGVRYCPSIEDKIVKFSEKPSHHVFIEPEGRVNDLIYPNGISNSLPREVQEAFVHSIPGLERAVLTQYAYAIEYDFADPRDLSHSLESQKLEGLFLAGQVNGTTGYEEAAGQGFVAGVNAALKTRGDSPLILQRSESYIGVLIDDLVTRGTDEPYRMFTSRAEHRLLLRQDNAQFRMFEHARRLGLQPNEYLSETELFQKQIDAERARLASTYHNGATLEQLLRRPDARYGELPGEDLDFHPEVQTQIEIQTKYHGYIERERRRIKDAGELERQRLPADIDYWKIDALRYECREKLARVRPENLGHASRIPGINPADLAILSVIIKRN